MILIRVGEIRDLNAKLLMGSPQGLRNSRLLKLSCGFAPHASRVAGAHIAPSATSALPAEKSLGELMQSTAMTFP